ncbi:U3 small nucleolar RNA-associated protein 6-domain-containing protein [Pyronema domesticum]|uniref:Similar to U3 small nucleolar RNA-associated protein 6 acc. no. Q02354 n=1 Tax=Pyronema omphalodes (strain CBS 100304) TaxID=1076935 RepID=U4KU48_PYROM|nr:U3 small nucleolar RNA-associated protein 6-domain-containing protein [Pyronema domesticum]CCX04753.1 Similar to U3 small nucleolar RNA-associated protein 6; acc. no. Q02354 [Pyronema omphalodes CBS 100304]
MAAEKARFYLEKSMPELREYEKKKIFTREEIAAITKKRTDFEHRINASGCSLNDFTRYVQYEMNLDALYRKRIKRMGIRTRMHYGTKRIFFIFDRATRKFPGDVATWLKYIEYAKKEKANNVVAKVLSSALKLHPAKPDLWIYAAHHAMDDNLDISEARGHMQRGLRFCNKSKDMWREYAKLEMAFVAKVFIRRKVLGIDAPAKKVDNQEEDDENMWKLPEVTGEELETMKKDKSLDTVALENVDTNPALNGALAIAIFDQAMKEIPGDLSFAEEFYNLFAKFTAVKCCEKLLIHTVKFMLDTVPRNARALWLGVHLGMFGVEPSDDVFPSRLQIAFEGMTAALTVTDNKKELYLSFTRHFTALLGANPDLNPVFRKAISASLSKYYKQAEAENEALPELYVRWAEFMMQRGKREEAVVIIERGLSRYPGEGFLLGALEKIKSL